MERDDYQKRGRRGREDRSPNRRSPNSRSPNRRSPNGRSANSRSPDPPKKIPKRSDSHTDTNRVSAQNGNYDGPSTSSGYRRTNPNVESQAVVKRKGNRFEEMVNTRPEHITSKKGTTGTPVKLQTNFYRLLKAPEWNIYQYTVEFKPEVESTKLRHAYLRQHTEQLCGYIFDGVLMFSPKKFYDFQREPSLQLTTVNREGETIEISIKMVAVIRSDNIQQLQVLNLIQRRAIKGLNLQLIGRNHYDPTSKIEIRDFNFEIWPGLETAIRHHEYDILLRIDVAHKVMRTDTLYGILMRCRAQSASYADDFKKLVMGTVVLTDYNNKTYKVDDVDFTKSPLSTFTTKTGEISFVDYYSTHHHLPINDKRQPLLVSRSTERRFRGGNENQLILLIPELCRPTGLTEEMRKNFSLVQAMGRHTRLRPDQRIERLRAFNTRLQEARQSVDVLRAWDVRLDNQLVEVEGRVITRQKIFFGNNAEFNCDQRADWTGQFRSNQQFEQAKLRRWCVIVPRFLQRDAQQFVQCIQTCARGMRMQVENPTYQTINDDRTVNYCQAINYSMRQDPQILVVILGSNNAEKYAAVKKLCCVDDPIPSQVLTKRVITPRGGGGGRGGGALMSVATKVLIQMNAKLKGMPWMIHIPLSKVMFVGFDMSVSKRDKSKAYGVLVASLDLTRESKFYSHVCENSTGSNIASDISMGMLGALKQYHKECGYFPKKIIFYRDGVGDGQIQLVFDNEVTTLRSTIDRFCMQNNAEKAKFTYIIVSKRISTKLFQDRRNPPPGTVVDDVITLPERYDFYLISQSVNQGTVSPTNYNVLYDDSDLPPDRMQILTYKLTHLYYNWTGTLRVPAMCQYAKKLSTLVAEHLHRIPSATLNTQLYFL